VTTTGQRDDDRLDAGDRLDSWKEIAGFFGKDERTVKRWEKSRGLPVRRVPGGQRNTVFAYSGELEQWLGGGEARPAPAEPVQPERIRVSPLAIVLILALLTIGAAGVYFVTGHSETPGADKSAHVAPAEAHDLVLSGTYSWNTRTEDGLKQAVSDFSSAIALDPDYAEAYAGLANAYNLLSQYSLMPAADAYPKAKAAAERAIVLDPNLAEAYAALAFNEFYWGRHFAHSGELFEKAIALDPNSPQANHWYALTAMHMGQYDKPLHYIERALELMPQSRAVRANKALILFHAGQVNAALSILKALRVSDPDFLATSSYLATIYLAQRRWTEFLDEYTQAAKVENNPAGIAIAEAARKGFAEGGGDGLLRAMLAEQVDQFDAGAEPAYKLALTAAMLGDNPGALSYLDIAVTRDESDVLGIRIEPAFKTLYGESRFRALLAKVGLPGVD
jgi:tetratricopeptide (TPR) repeat protein